MDEGGRGVVEGWGGGQGRMKRDGQRRRKRGGEGGRRVEEGEEG